MSTNFDIFISHSHKDSQWARQLAQGLRDRGVSVWLAEDQISPGEEWGRKIREGLRESSHIVFLVGAGASRSNALSHELGMALGEGKLIIPVVDADVPAEEIPGPIRRRQYLKKGDPKAVAEEIAEALAGLPAR
jgi:TIR domain